MLYQEYMLLFQDSIMLLRFVFLSEFELWFILCELCLLIGKLKQQIRRFAGGITWSGQSGPVWRTEFSIKCT